MTGPLAKAGTNVIVGIVQDGRYCTEEGFRLGIYQNIVKPEVQEFIRKIVPDLEIEGNIKYNILNQILLLLLVTYGLVFICDFVITFFSQLETNRSRL